MGQNITTRQDVEELTVNRHIQRLVIESENRDSELILVQVDEAVARAYVRYFLNVSVAYPGLHLEGGINLTQIIYLSG